MSKVQAVLELALFGEPYLFGATRDVAGRVRVSILYTILYIMLYIR